MKILFVWPGLTGYMGDCWRQLVALPGVELKISVDLGEKYFGGNYSMAETLRGLDWSEKLPECWVPDIVFTVGWHNKLCRSAALKDWSVHTKKVCCFDMPWEWRVRKFAAKIVLWKYLRRFDAAYVPGQSAAAYAKWLGFKRIYMGLFSTDLNRFGPHIGGDGFLYVGREVREKGVDVLKVAHKLYRERGGTWPLKIVSGVQPHEVSAYYAKADCFVLASRWEPWGVVLSEAAGAGLPIICTDKCGARHEIVREGENGFVVKSENVKALAEAMARAWELRAGAPNEVAEYSCENWAKRTLEIANGFD